MSGKLAQIIEDVKTLSLEERLQLRQELDILPAEPGDKATDEEKLKGDQLDQLLLARGIISRIPPPITDPTPYQQWKPVPINGKPLSETIIEERR